MPTPLSAIGAKCSHEVSELLLKWPDIKNIIDLVNCCRHIHFFLGDVTKGVLSVIRYETCYQYLEYNKNGIHGFINTKPEQVAKKGLGGHCGTLATGLIISVERTISFLEGGCQEFYNLKTTIKSHIMLGRGQFHYEALKHDQEKSKRMARARAVTENLIRIALSIVNVKAAALHYETLVASHQLTGSDVGEFSHGQKQF
ncbi:Hypothetical predicted protein [Paramuricea clavata]|uniref:Uncharacterized protein n=1 Tax=Paramuricea clavata TaxID=317549 RepID=A0A7D9DKB7_PARCT|nr:Hypothetical predicted protein [Paramuricea clavata]